MLRTLDDALWDVRHGPLSSEPSIPSLDALSSDTLVLPSAHLLLHGDYARSGLDLLIRDGDDRLVIHDYFRPGRKPDLMAPDGAVLNAATVEAIAVGNGHETAQAGGTAPPPIGRVETVGGTASAIRNGVQVVLRPGELVYQGDTVQTDRGGSLAITFVDGTAFSLSGSSRMVLNEMVYQAGATNNSSLMSLVSGSISFVAGQVAKTGDMRVDTPVATMGIRGTAVGWTQLDVTTDGTTQLAVRPERFVVSEEPDGHTGSYEIRSKATGQLLGIVSQNDRAVIVTPTGTTDLAVNDVTKSPADIAIEQSIVRGIFGIMAAAQPIPTGPAQGPQQPNPNPNPGTGPQNGGAPGSSTSPNTVGGDQPNPLSNTRDGAPPPPTPPSAPDVPPIASLAPAPAIGVPTPVAAGASAPVTPPTDSPAPVATAIVVPALLGQTITLDQKEAVVARTPDQGLLARPGVEPATLAAEKVVSAHSGTGASAGPEVAVAQGTTAPTTVEGRYGTLGIRDDGTYAYVALRAATLHEGETGTDSFTYRTNDGLTQTVVFQVAGHNDAPDPVSDAAAANLATGGGAISATTRAAGVLGNDTDPDHDETLLLTVSAVSGLESGTATVNGSATAMAKGHYGSLAIASDGTWTYTPDGRATALPGPGHGDAPAHELFTVTVVDPSGAAATETLDIAVTGVNDAPTAHADTAAVPTSGHLSIAAGTGLLANDTDPDLGDTLTVSAIRSGSTGPDHAVGPSGTTEVGLYGSLTVFADGSYRYDADENSGLARDASAVDSFTETIADRDGLTSTASLQITVTGVNHAPVAAADTASVTDGTQPNATGNVITGDPTTGAGRDSDADHDTLTVSALKADAAQLDTFESDGTYGRLTIVKSTGDYTYTVWTDVADATADQVTAVRSLGAGAHGDDKFTYTVDDGHGGSASATLTITVTGINDAPTAHDDGGFSTRSDTPLTLHAADLLANDTDPDGDALTIMSLGEASGGSVVRSGSDIVFTPDGSGSDGSFTYTVSDGHDGTASATVSVTVTPASSTDLVEAGDGTPGTAIAVKAVPAADGTTVDPNLGDGGWRQLSPVESGGHSYVYVPVYLTWSDANALALSLGGHLATITSAQENAAVQATLGYQYAAFIGATDAGHSGHWNWVSDTGSGEGANFWNGTYVESDNGSVLQGGTGPVPGAYTNWAQNGSPVIADEPNDLGGHETVAEIYYNGRWNDEQDSQNLQQGFVLEFETPASAAPALYIAPVLYGNAILSATAAGFTLTYSLQNGGFSEGGGSADPLPGGQVFTDAVSPPLLDADGNPVAAVTFTVAGTNDAPRAGQIDPQYVEPGSDYQTNVGESFYDPDRGDILTLSAQGLPAWATFDPSTGQLSGTPTEVDFGTSTVQITGTDSFGASTTSAFALVVDFAPAIVAPTNLATNPGFEDESAGPYAPGSSFEGWTVDDSAGSAGPGIYIQSAFSGVGLLANLQQTGAVSQTLATVAGETYKVNFQLDPDVYAYRNDTVGVSVDGGHETIYTAEAYSEVRVVQQTFTFTATGAATVLTFQSHGDDPFVDAVSVTRTDTALEQSGHHVASGSIAFTDRDGLLDTHGGGTIGLPSGAITYLDAAGDAFDASSLSAASIAALLSAFHTGAVHEPVGSVAGSLDYTFDVADQVLGFMSAGETLTLSFDVPVVDANGRQADASVPITIHGPASTGALPGIAADTVIAGGWPTDIPTEALLFNDGDGSHAGLTVTAVTSGATLDSHAALVETSYEPGDYAYKAVAADGASGLGAIHFGGVMGEPTDLTAPSGGAILLGAISDGSAGQTLHGGAGTDVFVLPYDAAGNSKATTSLLQITGFDTAHDAFDLHDLKATSASAIDRYVTITPDGHGGAILAVSRDGSEPFQAQAHLDAVATNDAFTVIWDHHVAQVTAHYATF